MSKGAVLIIDDEAPIRKLLEITLQAYGFRVWGAATGSEGLDLARESSPDLVLLDLGLPDESGFSVLKKLRHWYTNPVIILSVQSDEEAIVSALDNGANDYLTKPFRTGELLARIRSSLRKIPAQSGLQSESIPKLEIDVNLRMVKKNGELIKLTATEYDLLSLLFKNEGRVLTHQYLLREIWGPGYIAQSQHLRVFIAQLRKKIEADPTQPEFIITESGVGYRFIIKEQGTAG